MALRRKQKYTRRAFKQRGGTHGKVYVFFHIHCNHNTKAIVSDQCMKILFSGLYERVEAVYCFLTGETRYIDEIEKLLTSMGKKFIVKEKGPGDKSYERFTLLKVKPLIKPEDRLLYIHSKGVTKDVGVNAVYWWRSWMEYFLIAQFKKCLDELEKHDTVGVNYSAEGIGPHFSGNFWWSTGKYYLTLPDTIGPKYNDPETYVFSKNPKYLDISPGISDIRLYWRDMLPNGYVDVNKAPQHPWNAPS